jgi:T-complex protein 1 subunit eta
MPQLVSNINACMALADTVRTTLGPRGMDKLIHDDKVGRCAEVVGGMC